MIRYWVVGLVLLAAGLLTLPVEKTTELKNYGVRERSVGGTLTSEVADKIFVNKGYEEVSRLVPYVKECSKVFDLPPEILLAILYEEAVHRKPVDLQTFGVAQIGVGELLQQGLPPDPDLLNNNRFSVWILARKLKRIQIETGSLRKAIILHNGYSDYLKKIEKRATDPRIKALLNQKHSYPVFTA
jgi:hypothetical protein